MIPQPYIPPLLLGALLALLPAAATPPQQQEEHLQKTLRLFEKQALLYPHEKVYLHTDKPCYAAGDTLWFAGYVASAITNAPSDVSGILLVDLISSSSQVVARQKWKVSGGFTRGQIALGSALAQDAYTLRAYTAWMCNFDSSYFFYKTVNVFRYDLSADSTAAPPAVERKKSRRQAAQAKPPVEAKVRVRFFPEGGQMVEGIASRVAFEVRDERGNPLTVKGRLQAGGGEAVAVESNFAGYGSLTLTPQRDTEYRLSVAHGGGEYSFALPKPQAYGAVMRCDNAAPSALTVKISGRFEQPEDGQGMLLVGHVRGELSFALPVNVRGGKATQVKILTGSYPQGVMHLTLISGAGIPCAERLTYVDRGERVDVGFAVQRGRGIAQRSNLAITTTDQSGTPVPARLSLSVTDEALLLCPDSAEESIRSYMLLASDLPGRIYRPGYYFGGAPTAGRDLDLLLLTQGWRRFKVDLRTADSLPPIRYPVEKQLALSGRVRGENPKRVQEYSISLFSYYANGAKHGLFRNSPDADGRFSFLFDDYYGELYATLTTRNRRNRLRSLDVSLSQSPQPPFAPPPNIPDLAAALRSHSLLDSQRYARSALEAAIAIDEVVVEGARTDFPAIDMSIGATLYPDYVLLREDVMKFAMYDGAVIKAIQAKAPEIRERRDAEGGLALTVAGLVHNPKNPFMGVMVDRIPMSADYLNTLKAEEVSSIRIYKTIAAAHALGELDGVAAAHTSYIVVSTTTPPRGVIAAMIKGFEEAREFYVPSSENYHFAGRRRATVFWKTDVETDATGRATVSIPVPTGRRGSIRLRAEGMTQQGAPAFGMYSVDYPL